MSVAIRAITRLQDADDLNVTLGAGVDEYALCWDNDTAKFVLRAIPAVVTDHGALTGLTPDDDHTQYALLAGRAGGQTLYGGTAANDDITIHGTSDATRTTSYVILQPTAGNVGIGTTAPSTKLHVSGSGAGANGRTFASIENTTADSAAGIKLTNSASRSASFQYSGPSYVVGEVFSIYTASDVPIVFSTNADLISGGTVGYISFSPGGYASERMRVLSSGNVGIGTTAPATPLHTVSTTATTNALRNVLTLGANVTGAGVGAGGLGAGLLFTMETTTTIDTSAASVQAIIYEATHATRKFDLVGNAYDTAIREGWRVRGNGSAPAIGFLGATPQARIAHVADPAGGATVDAEARSAINSILSTLELFGLHAAS